MLAALAVVGVVPAAAAPTENVRTLAQANVPITALAQDGRRIAWLQPRARRRSAIKNLVTGAQVSLPRHRFASEIDAPEPLPVLALAGSRVVYVLYEEQGNTEQHFFYVATGAADRAERLVGVEFANDCPCYSVPTPPMTADGSNVLFQTRGRIFRLAGRRPVRVQGRPVGDLLALSGRRYASAWLRSSGGCICNLTPSWSPDGSRIAYTSNLELGDPERAGAGRIRVVAASGGPSRVIARGLDPDWSPDGSSIAYVRLTDPVAIWMIRPDGTGARRLVAGGSPDWHPDGSRFAFARSDGFIYVAGRDGSGVRRVTAGSVPAWSPDGRRLAYVSVGDVYVANADGSGATRLTQRQPGDETWHSDPAWSPDGLRIAYTTYRETHATGEIDETRVSVVNVDGTGARPLNVGRALMPAWSPDGSRIAYGGWLQRRHPVRGTPSTEIFTSALDGSGQVRVSETRPAEPTSAGFVRSLGKRKRTVPLTFAGVAWKLALTPAFAAVLAEGFFGKQAVFLHPRTGRLLRRIGVPQEATELAAAGSRVVFLVGKEIRLIDRRGVTTLAVAPVTPSGLSIEGRRVAWIENSGGRGRIRALTLPR